MTFMASTAPPPATGPAKFSFLASHGLRSPLSAIRWACGRLSKATTGTLNAEQEELVSEIHANAKVLTTVLGSMQLLGKLEDRSYRLKHEQIVLHDMLLALTHCIEHPRAVDWHIDCAGEPQVMTDGPILECILVNILTVCMETGIGEKRIAIRARSNGDVTIRVFSPLELPFLHVDDGKSAEEKIRMIGGVPGLMLCLAKAMAQFLKGDVDLREVPRGAEAEVEKVLGLGSGTDLYHCVILTLPAGSV